MLLVSHSEECWCSTAIPTTADYVVQYSSSSLLKHVQYLVNTDPVLGSDVIARINLTRFQFLLHSSTIYDKSEHLCCTWCNQLIHDLLKLCFLSLFLSFFQGLLLHSEAPDWTWPQQELTQGATWGVRWALPAAEVGSLEKQVDYAATQFLEVEATKMVGSERQQPGAWACRGSWDVS